METLSVMGNSDPYEWTDVWPGDESAVAYLVAYSAPPLL